MSQPDGRAVNGTRIDLPRPRWSIGWVLDPRLAPAAQRADAQLWRDRPFRGVTSPCWTYRGAVRKALRRNRRSRYQSPGLWEVFGPLGKGED